MEGFAVLLLVVSILSLIGSFLLFVIGDFVSQYVTHQIYWVVFSIGLLIFSMGTLISSFLCFILVTIKEYFKNNNSINKKETQEQQNISSTKFLKDNINDKQSDILTTNLPLDNIEKDIKEEKLVETKKDFDNNRKKEITKKIDIKVILIAVFILSVFVFIAFSIYSSFNR